MSEKPEQYNRGYIRQAWLVIILALCYGGALAGVETTLGPKIAENKENETYDRIPDLVPGTSGQRTVEVNKAEAFEVQDEQKRQRIFKAVDDNGGHTGWVLPARGQGFVDRIELLIGLDSAVTTITGIWVLDQKETPQLGSYIQDAPFQNQFAGKSAEKRVQVVKTDPSPDSNEITALSGATISSESVAKIVNDAIANYREAIRDLSEASLPASAPAPTGNDQ